MTMDAKTLSPGLHVVVGREDDPAAPVLCATLQGCELAELAGKLTHYDAMWARREGVGQGLTDSPLVFRITKMQRDKLEYLRLLGACDPMDPAHEITVDTGVFLTAMRVGKVVTGIWMPEEIPFAHERRALAILREAAQAWGVALVLVTPSRAAYYEANNFYELTDDGGMDPALGNEAVRRVMANTRVLGDEAARETLWPKVRFEQL